MRRALLILAVALAIEGTWILSAAILRTDVRTLPVGPAQIAQAKAVEFRALEAARVGWVRGDLWAESTYARSYLAGPDAPQLASSDESNARANTLEDCGRALSLAPITPGLWALCALLDENHSPSSRADKFLEMSYYTGLNAHSVIPVRLLAAARSNIDTDNVIQSFVERDIALVLTKLQDLKPSLVAAYKDALPQNRAMLLRYIEENDPAFVAKLSARTLQKDQSYQ